MADDEIRMALKQILEILPTMATKKDLERLATKEDLEALRAELTLRIDTEARVINARLDEQGRILAAMIPTRIAAVPPAAE